MPGSRVSWVLPGPDSQTPQRGRHRCTWEGLPRGQREPQGSGNLGAGLELPKQGRCGHSAHPRSEAPTPPLLHHLHPQDPAPQRAWALACAPSWGPPPSPPRSTPLEGRKQEDPPKERPHRTLLPPPTHEYIKLCSLAPPLPCRSPWQPGSSPSPSPNPSPSSAKGGLQPLPSLFPGGVRPSIPQGVPGGGEGESGASVLRPLLLSVGGAWGLLGLGGLPAGLGARPVLALHVDAQPLGTGLLATGLAAAMQDLLH